jgi:hypothetical protein
MAMVDICPTSTNPCMFKRLRGMGGMGEGMFDYCVRMFMTGTIAGYVELSLDLNLLLKLCFVLIPSSTLVFPWIMNAWLNFISTDLSRGTTILTPPKNRWGVVNLPFPFFSPWKLSLHSKWDLKFMGSSSLY